MTAEGRVREPGRPARSRGCAGPCPARGEPSPPSPAARTAGGRLGAALPARTPVRGGQGEQLCLRADGGARRAGCRGCAPARPPARRAGRRRPSYLLQQRPQAQLVRAAALRPLAHIGRRHQPLAAALVLRVHGRGVPPPLRAGPCEPGTSRREGAGGGGAAHAELRGPAPPPAPRSGQSSAGPPPAGPSRTLGGAGAGVGPSSGCAAGGVWDDPQGLTAAC